MFSTKLLGVEVLEPTPSKIVQNLLLELIKALPENGVISTSVRSWVESLGYDVEKSKTPQVVIVNNNVMVKPAKKVGRPKNNVFYENFETIKNAMKAKKPIYLIAKDLGDKVDEKKLKNFIYNKKLHLI